MEFWGKAKAYPATSEKLKGLPQGIIHANSDFKLWPLWLRSSSRSKPSVYSNCYLLAVPFGIKQMPKNNGMSNDETPMISTIFGYFIFSLLFCVTQLMTLQC